MVDSNIDIDVHSTASSDISESLREQILGKGYSKEKYKKPIRKNSGFYIVTSEDLKSEGRHNYSYHTALSDSTKADEKDFIIVSKQSATKPIAKESDSFVMVPSNPNSTHSMKNLKKNEDNARFISNETQTVAIQTVAAGTDPAADAEISSGDRECDCPCCRAEKYKSNHNSAYIPDESSEPSVSYDGTESSTPTISYGGCYCRHCTCKSRDWDYESSATEQLSDSDDSFSTDFFDLPYQNNEEYLKLLKELEKKLLARNKQRVRKTMMEFEKRSRQNQNLEKPICDYNCDDTASMLRKLASRNRKKPCCKCGKKKVNSDILQNEKKWEKMDYVQSMVEEDSIKSVSNRVEKSLHKSHWKLDPRSGEWVKISCFHEQSDCCRPPHGDCIKDDYHSKLPPIKKECCCRQKRH